MRVLHFDCFSGISGDMTLGALVSLGVPAEVIQQGLACLGLPVHVEFESVKRCGFVAVQARVQAQEEHHHRHLRDIDKILHESRLPPEVRELAGRIFQRLAAAEAAVHGQSVEKVHFHEVGALDSIADIVGVAAGLCWLRPQRYTSSPVATGYGQVRGAHGWMPIPAPGTLQLLRGVPLAPSTVEAELTTPTGAAILTTLVDEWTPTPALTVHSVGYGAGSRDFPDRPNVLRLILGTTSSPQAGLIVETIAVLETQVDDVSPQALAYCQEQLFAAGALDVLLQPVYMKKNRPGILISVLASLADVPALEAILFRETRTLGVRHYTCQRHKYPREAVEVTTPWGTVRGKLVRAPNQPPRFAPEYEDCARIARQTGRPLVEILQWVSTCYPTPAAAPSAPGRDQVA
ncbi:MAG: nickel pincer cofactor biosynthesis protein LarC [Gemmatales bacterium]|nr:nickel pincer cofactor biosynthesis protein LarC [Gemmatales bacterium]MDW8222388.1 nickel pincer cofactor biosynthesis protein LarC [Gemmatales bacterium]